MAENGYFSTIFDFSAQCLSDGKHGWYDSPDITFKKWRETIINSQLDVQKVGFEANIRENHDDLVEYQDFYLNMPETLMVQKC